MTGKNGGTRESETGERTDRSSISVSDQRQTGDLPVDMACIPASANTKQLDQTQIHQSHYLSIKL